MENSNNLINIAQVLTKLAYEESLANELRRRNELINALKSSELIKSLVTNMNHNTDQNKSEPFNVSVLQNLQNSSLNQSQILNFQNACKSLSINQGTSAIENSSLKNLGTLNQLTQGDLRNNTSNLQISNTSMTESLILRKLNELCKNSQITSEKKMPNTLLHEKVQRSSDPEEELMARTNDVSRIPSNNQVLENAETVHVLSNPSRTKFSISLKDICKETDGQDEITQEVKEEVSGEDIILREATPKPSCDKLKFYRCTFRDCDKVFPKECNLKDHIRTHTGEKPFKCIFPGCEKSFSQQGNLKKHEKVHVGEKKFMCEFPDCGKKFSASYNLKIHNRSHLGEKPYICNFENCGRAFYDKGNLKYHEKSSHFSESVSYPYSCEHMGCNMKFKTKKQKLIHHNKMELECKTERNSLIKLLRRFKELMQNVLSSDEVDLNNFESYTTLRKFYEETERKLLDPDYFHCMLGKNFDDKCPPLEDDEDRDL